MAFHSKAERAKQYLLGTLSPVDKANFEEDYFTDHELFEEMEIAEDELVDAYIRKDLSEDDLNKFETNLISSPRLTQRVEFARTLAKSISRSGLAAVESSRVVQAQSSETITPASATSDDEEPFWRRILFPKSSPRRSFTLAFASFILLLLLGGGTLFLAWMRLRAEQRQLASERAELQQRNQNLALENEKHKSELAAQLDQARAENARLSQELETVSKREPSVQQQQRTVTFLLIPGVLRSTGRRNLVEISPYTSNVKLRLRLPADDYSNYSASVKTVEQTSIWNKAQLKPQSGRDGKVVELSVPSSKLLTGTYIVELTGFNDSSNSERLPDYSFQVVRKRN